MDSWVPFVASMMAACFVSGWIVRGMLEDHRDRKRAAEVRRSIVDSGWACVIRNGKVNPKPAGPTPPVPVQTPRVQR